MFPSVERFCAALGRDQPGIPQLIVAAMLRRRGEFHSAVRGDIENRPPSQKPSPPVGPDTIAKILFTSGSTGTPKGVVNTQRMLCSNQQAIAADLAVPRGQPPVIVDWLPWSHTFGGNHNFNLVLRNGGTLYIDDGQPAPALIDGRVAQPARGLADALFQRAARLRHADCRRCAKRQRLRRRFFGELNLVFYAGAALPQNLWERCEDLSVETAAARCRWSRPGARPRPRRWPPSAISRPSAPASSACRCPGTELKLVPSGDKLEVRVRGPNVTPGYWKAPELTAQAFDADGFYLIGDAVPIRRSGSPGAGIVFDGRVAEDFKLTSGTWVSVGTLRVAGIAALAPLAQDIVVSGHDGDHVRFLVFPNIAACRALAGLPDSADVKAR